MTYSGNKQNFAYAHVLPGFEPTSLVLECSHYYPCSCTTCSSKPGLEWGLSEALVKAVIRHGLECDPLASHVALQDNSYTKCGGDSGIDKKEISLADHDMMIHGATWYMRKLGAVPGDKVCAAAVAEWQRHLNTPAPATRRDMIAALNGEIAGRFFSPKEVKLILDAVYTSDRAVTNLSWRQVYSFVDEMPNGCKLFGRLAAFAASVGETQTLRGMVFTVPSANA
jgi:hypothetical protein